MTELSSDISAGQFLNEKPSKEDKFGGHQRIADTLRQIITESPDSLINHSIALTGILGSGKSTVISLLKKDLKRTANIKIFIFNTWHHSGDFLRREFLFELLRFLKAENWITDNDYKKFESKLTYRITDRFISKKWILTPLLRIFFVLCIFSPLIDLLLTSHKVALHVVSFGGMLVLWGIMAIRERGLFSALDAMIRLILSREPELQRVTEKVSIENSTNEFIEFYSEILEQSLIKNVEKDVQGSRNIVIVFDDMDRIVPERMRQICDDLNIFTDYSRDCPALKKSWIIACFDQEKLEAAFPEPKKSNEQAASASGVSIPGRFHPRPSALPLSPAQLYLDRQFLTVMNVPAFLAFEERSFMHKCLEEAFPNMGDKEKEFSIVCRLFHRSRQLDKSSPRDVVVFVNRLVTLQTAWLKRPRNIPFSTEAVFVLMKSYRTSLEQISSEINKAIETYGDILPSITSAKFAEDFSLLAFNKDNLPYAGEMLTGIQGNGGDTLGGVIKKFLKSHANENEVKTFWFLFEQAIGPAISRMEKDRQSDELIFNPIYLLNSATEVLYKHYNSQWPSEPLNAKYRPDDVYDTGVFILWDAWRRISDTVVKKLKDFQETQSDKRQIVQNYATRITDLCVNMRNYGQDKSDPGIAYPVMREFLSLCFSDSIIKGKPTAEIDGYISHIKQYIDIILPNHDREIIELSLHKLFPDPADQGRVDEIKGNYNTYITRLEQKEASSGKTKTG